MKTALILIAFILIISLPLIVYAFSPKETFTELYFNNPESLPKIIKINEENNFSFTIISHEKGLKNYSYSIISELISENRDIALAPGENMTITRNIKAKEIGEGNVTVSIDSGQNIHFFYYIFE
jgi:uncharacterized membrane protein